LTLAVQKAFFSQVVSQMAGALTKSSNIQKLVAARTLRDAISALAAEAPERMSLPQLLFFLHAAEADLSGKPSTFSAIREVLGRELINSGTRPRSS
jgi:hypothetical protein